MPLQFLANKHRQFPA